MIHTIKGSAVATKPTLNATFEEDAGYKSIIMGLKQKEPDAGKQTVGLAVRIQLELQIKY